MTRFTRTTLIDMAAVGVTVSKDTKVFSLEMSDLGRGASLAQNVTLVSKRTGRLANFGLQRTDTYGEGIAGWYFAPTMETLRAHPRLHGWKLLVIND